MGSEVASVNSQQMDNFLYDIVLFVLDKDNVYSSIVPKLLKTHNYEVLHFQNLVDAYGAIDDKDNTIKLILTSFGTTGSKDAISSLRRTVNEMIMPVVFFHEKDRESLIQALEGVGGVAVYHIKNVNLADIKDIWHHIFVHKQPKKLAINTLQKQATTPADSASTSVIRDIKQPKGSSGGSEEAKKSRVAWTIELNNRFIEAYNQLGHQGATPCRILELMNDPRLTRFHIASHLQKYRAHLREMQEDLHPRRSKFSYKIRNQNLNSANCIGNPDIPHESFQHGANNLGSSENPGASFTKFLSNMEDEEQFALAQNHETPSLSPASSPDLDLADLSNINKFNDLYSSLQKCMSGETCSTSYVGFKISNEGELIWDRSESSPQPAAGEVAKTEMQLQPSPCQEQHNSGYDLVESPVTFDTEMLDFDIYELLDFDSSIQ